MPTFVQIAVNVPSLTGVFDYSLPEDLQGHVGIGHLVVVPFGKQTVQGVVLRFVDQPSVPQTKDVIELVDDEPVLSSAQISLAESLSESTYSPLALVIGLFLPPGLSQQADTLYEIRDSNIENRDSVIASRLIKLLHERGPLRGRQIDRHFKGVDWRKTAAHLVKRGILSSRSVLPPVRVRSKFVRTAQLSVPPAAAEDAMSDLGRIEATQTRRQKALRFLIRQPEAINVSWVYAESGCNLADLQELAERELVILRETEIWRDPLARIEEEELPKPEFVLTEEQRRAWEAIEVGFRNLADGKEIKPFLLQGVTGSGKTELYIRAAREAIKHGKQAIVLVPEIALTPQIVRRFLARFPGQIGLVHSKLSAGERYDTWRRARAGSLKVMIGPRSALFTPLPDIGLIVVDECHDGSYYQSGPPFYDARTTALTYARICGALCVMGSATPNVVQRYQTEAGESVRLELTQRIDSDPKTAALRAQSLDLPPIHIVDMRSELKAGNRGIFSRELTEALSGTLERHEQAILFLNRRGMATYVFCRDCGHVVKCPRCEAPMTYHVSSGEKLLCHRCGYELQVPKKCPECGGTNIRAYGLGSEKVEAEVNALFPKAHTLRWDWETTRQKDAHEIILSHFAAGRADVLVGTQMLAKGLDLPRVTLVGIVLADVGLHLPDPFAAERVFQVLTQVAGRAGRSSRGGRVVLQTFSPEHYAVRTAASHDVNGFYVQELAQRKRLGYPPFSHLVRLEIRDRDPRKAEQQARTVAAKIFEKAKDSSWRSPALIGPAPCFFSNFGGEYRWQIVLRGGDLRQFLPERLSPNWRIEVAPPSLL